MCTQNLFKCTYMKYACHRLKNDFPSFLSSLYVRTTNIYWRNSSLFSTIHPIFLHSCPFRRSAEHILFRAKIYFQTKIHTIIAGGTKWEKRGVRNSSACVTELSKSLSCLSDNRSGRCGQCVNKLNFNLGLGCQSSNWFGPDLMLLIRGNTLKHVHS
jgi:hypothetical protein